MFLRSLRRAVSAAIPQIARAHRDGARYAPERVVLEAETASDARPPVRIFVGSEAGQHRAERVLIWSIETTRDRTRRYEILLMKDLVGFDRTAWLTGFTNYRFAIPHLTDSTGRAIYNDVDQIYLTDPAELFDCDMHGHGFMATTDRDTSVMLIDCERMGTIWRIEDARRMRRKKMEALARVVPDCWGPLDRTWNSRDEEYAAGRSKLLHYTTIHTQPWRPFPEQYVYQHNAVADIWLDMERAADAAQFQVFSFAQPTSTFADLIAKHTAAKNGLAATRSEAVRADLVSDLRASLEHAESETILEVAVGESLVSSAIRSSGGSRPIASTLTRYDPLAPARVLSHERFDAVVCVDFFDILADQDVPWVLDQLFRRAHDFLYLAIGGLAQRSRTDRFTIRDHTEEWWIAQLEAAAARYPAVHWKLWTDAAASTKRRAHIYEGGRRLRRDGVPNVWVLADHKAGHATQSFGLADALGWPCEIKELSWNPLQLVTDRLLGPTAVDLGHARGTNLRPPWPDLVISTGWRTAPIARWIASESDGKTHTVQMGRKGGGVAEHFDLVVTCKHFRFFPHRHRLEITAPLNQVTPQRLEEADARFPDLFRSAPRPRVVLLVGGHSRQHRLDEAIARRMGEDVGAWALRAGGLVHAITSPRTGRGASDALEAGLANTGQVHRWKANDTANPYLAYLAGADVIVVTGESESMVSEALATDKPVYIYRLPARIFGPVQALAGWITQQACARRRKLKGTVSPQQGLAYACARAIERGWVLPPRDVTIFERDLVERGAVRCFGEPLEIGSRIPLDERDRIVTRIEQLIGYCAERSGDARAPADVQRVAAR